jgi:hypothetical protein
MAHLSRFTALFDANVLYPAPLRDLLMRLAMTDLFRAKWSALPIRGFRKALLCCDHWLNSSNHRAASMVITSSHEKTS